MNGTQQPNRPGPHYGQPAPGGPPMGGPQSVHSIAYAKAQHMLNELGDLNPEHPPAMPNLLQLDNDINELFKPIEIPELK